jgi:RHS repeat-associated protein
MSRTYSAIITDQNAQDYMTQPTTPSASIFFIHPDHLNTPRLVANANQQAVWKWDQAEPFGVNAPNENPSSLGVFELPIRFPGQYADKETNTHYNYYRDYDPQTGRYSQSDPLGVRGGLATYVYVKNDSLSRIDPSGLQSVTGNWMIRPRFNIQDKGIDGWEFVSPSWSLWGYMKFVRLRGHASGYVNIDVKCVADCGNEWEIHNRISVEASGSIDVGPNLYGIIGGFAVGPYLGASINIVLAGASLLQAEYHFLSLVQQKAGGIIAGVLAHGPTAMCLGTQQ